jgi:hypothetical protein
MTLGADLRERAAERAPRRVVVADDVARQAQPTARRRSVPELAARRAGFSAPT